MALTWEHLKRSLSSPVDDEDFLSGSKFLVGAGLPHAGKAKGLINADVDALPNFGSLLPAVKGMVRSLVELANETAKRQKIDGRANLEAGASQESPTIMRSPEVLLKETEESSRSAAVSWMKIFNSGDAEAMKQLGLTYCEDAVLHIDLGEATLWFFGSFSIPGPYFVCRGRKQIERFWGSFMQKVKQFCGFHPDRTCTVCVKDSRTVILQSKFNCNAVEGWIHGRYMLRDNNDKWMIQADHIELDKAIFSGSGGENISQLAVAEKSVVKGRSLSDKQVRDSLFEEANAFKEFFNRKDHQGCASAYADTTVLHADIPAVKTKMAEAYGYTDPVVLRNKKEIELFWKRMIHEVGLKDMKAYESARGEFPMTICVLDDDTALVRSKWRMNAVGGHIHSQLMRRDEADQWSVDMDFFSIYDAY